MVTHFPRALVASIRPQNSFTFSVTGLDLIEHQAGNNQPAPRLDGRPKSGCGFSEEIAIEVGGHDIKAALRPVLEDIRTKQFQPADLVQMSICFRYPNGGGVRIEAEHPFGPESCRSDRQNAGSCACIQEFPVTFFRGDIR